MDTELLEKELSAIRQRLENLESGNFQERTIRCRNIRVTDDAGHSRIFIGITESGGASIAFANSDGNVQVFLSSADDEPVLMFKAKSGETVAQIGVSEKGDGEIRICTSDGEGLIHAGTTDVSNPSSFGLTFLQGEEYRMAFQLLDWEPALLMYASTGNGIVIQSNKETCGVAWVDGEGQPTKIVTDGD